MSRKTLFGCWLALIVFVLVVADAIVEVASAAEPMTPTARVYETQSGLVVCARIDASDTMLCGLSPPGLPIYCKDLADDPDTPGQALSCIGLEIHDQEEIEL